MLIITSPINVVNIATAGSMNLGTINLTSNTSNMKMQGGSASFNVGEGLLLNAPLNNNTPVFFDSDLLDTTRGGVGTF